MEPKKRFPWKTITKVGAVTSLVTANALYGAANFLLWKGLRPKRIPNTMTPDAYALPFEEVAFQNAEGLTLKGWWIPATTNRTIIFSHGYGKNRSTGSFPLFDLAMRLHNEGYNLLLYDFRNSGESEGKMGSIAQKEQEDVLAAIAFVKTQHTPEQLILMGWSMGASASLLAGSQSDDVDAIIADSPFARLDTYLVDSFSHWTKLPHFLGKMLYTLSAVNPFGFKAKDVQPIQAVAQGKEKPVLLIHAQNDPTISYKESVAIKEAVPRVELWTPEDGLHTQCYRVYPEEYETRLLAFLARIKN